MWNKKPSSCQISHLRLDFPFRHKKGKFIFLLVWSAWKKRHPFCSNLNDLCITTGAFSFPEQPVTVFLTLDALILSFCGTIMMS